MHISDTLSRASLPIPEIKEGLQNYQIFQINEETKKRKAVEERDMEDSLFVTDQRLGKILQATATDDSLQNLMTCIKDGWPDSKADIPMCIKEFLAIS